jgi:hypothetical protein
LRATQQLPEGLLRELRAPEAIRAGRLQQLVSRRDVQRYESTPTNGLRPAWHDQVGLPRNDVRIAGICSGDEEEFSFWDAFTKEHSVFSGASAT